MAGFARLIAIFDRGAVVDVLAAAPTGNRGPEIIEHVAVETNALAWSEPDHPYPHPVGFRNQGSADTAVVVLPFALEFRGERRRPGRFIGAIRGFIEHGQCHSVPP